METRMKCWRCSRKRHANITVARLCRAGARRHRNHVDDSPQGRVLSHFKFIFVRTPFQLRLLMYDGLSYPCLSIFPQMLGLIPIPTVSITERQLQRMMLAGLRGAAEWGVKRWCHWGVIGGAWACHRSARWTIALLQ